MGADSSTLTGTGNPLPSAPLGFLHCTDCEDWVQGEYHLRKHYPCFNAPACHRKLRPLTVAPSTFYYHCYCGHIASRLHYTTAPAPCPDCGVLVRGTTQPPETHHFLCKCGNCWEKACYGNETEPCLACGWEVLPRAMPPTRWFLHCQCGSRDSVLAYKPPVFSCASCREEVLGESDPPTVLYYKCKACPGYFKDSGYTHIAQPCRGCTAKVWPSALPTLQHYLCPDCGMYFSLRADPNELLKCGRQGCGALLTPSLQRPRVVYLRAGEHVRAQPRDDTLPLRPAYFLCNCGSSRTNYWWECEWNPSFSQHCEQCLCDIYPSLQPLPNRAHLGFFTCECRARWRSDQAYPGVTQSCSACGVSVRATHIEPKPSRGIVV